MAPPRLRTVQRCAIQEVAQKWVIFQRGVLALVKANHDPTPGVFDCLQFSVREVCCFCLSPYHVPQVINNLGMWEVFWFYYSWSVSNIIGFLICHHFFRELLFFVYRRDFSWAQVMQNGQVFSSASKRGEIQPCSA